jgi:hypothetical protein
MKLIEINARLQETKGANLSEPDSWLHIGLQPSCQLEGQFLMQKLPPLMPAAITVVNAPLRSTDDPVG